MTIYPTGVYYEKRTEQRKENNHKITKRGKDEDEDKDKDKDLEITGLRVE